MLGNTVEYRTQKHIAAFLLVLCHLFQRMARAADMAGVAVRNSIVPGIQMNAVKSVGEGESEKIMDYDSGALGFRQ